MCIPVRRSWGEGALVKLSKAEIFLVEWEAREFSKTEAALLMAGRQGVGGEVKSAFRDGG